LLPDFLLSRRWGFYPYLATELAKTFCVVTFDPSTCPFTNEGEPQLAADQLDRYCFSAELEDLDRVLTQLRQGRVDGPADCLPAAAPWRVGLVGHTKGGALALVRASEDKNVAAVACLSAICTMNRLTDGARERLLAEGRLPIQDPASNRQVWLGRRFLEDFRAHPERFTLERIARDLEVPLLLVHGEEDSAAGIEEAETLYHWTDKNRSRLVVLEKTGHTFGAEHPFHEPTADLERVAEMVGMFLERSVGEPSA
jgi:pimeloyl-ACP methyl ester carboxylesterase